jgi:hypothetical protein
VCASVVPASAQARPAAADPIVGFWNYGGGVVQVTGGPSTFTGTIVKATRFSDCDHPVGEVIWQITKNGDTYTGTHQWFGSAAPECRLGGTADRGRSTWTIDDSGAQLVLHQCTTNPRDSADTRCADLTRAKPVVLKKYTFSFSAYGNPQRPFPGYVGEFQLGPVRVSGSGWATAAGGSGSISLSADLKDKKYPTHRATMSVVKLLAASSSGGVTVLEIQIRMAGHSYPFICPSGTLGILRLIDDDRELGNGFNRDGVQTNFPNPSSTAPDGGLACRTHTHGMNNTDVSWTDPPKGGYPGGGLWARVNLGTSSPTAPRGPQTAQAALNVVKALVLRNKARCKITYASVRISGRPGRWNAVATLTTFGNRGRATWTIVNGKVSPTNQLAAEVGKGCP